jgi:two-component system response regulator HydG
MTTTKETRVLIVDDEQNMCELIQTDLRLRDIPGDWFTSASAALDAIREREYDVVLTDVRMPGTTGLQLCRQLSDTRPDIPVIVMTAFGSLETAVSAIRSGAYDFVTKPIEMDLLAVTLRRAIEHRQLKEQVRVLQETHEARSGFAGLLGESPVMQRLYDQLQQVAASEAGVLITGESGTGKEIVARAVHEESRRSDKPFVAINCGALSETLLESELFGHRKGAFTDASSDRKGLFLEADGGTLLLDEMGEMPMTMQIKLLRTLEERTVRPIGSDKETPFDVRMLAATNRDLETAVAEGRFREDLYYRINVIGLELPALRSRGADILRLARYFIQQFATKENKQVTDLAEGVGEKLLSYSWPGNVRELRNVMERAVALTRYDHITVEDLPDKIQTFRGGTVFVGGLDPTELVPMEEIERRYITHVLEAAAGNQTQAARILGLDRKTLYRKLKQRSVEDGGRKLKPID